MRSYEAARTLFSFLAFCAWSVVVIGVLVALIGASGGSRYGGAGAGLLAMAPGIGIAISGLLLLAFVQTGRAGVDTAEYTQQMLKIARDQLEVSRQALKGEGSHPKRYETITTQGSSKGGFEKADFGPVTNRNGDEKPEAISKPAPAMIEGEKLEYLGQTITRKNGMYVTSGMSYDSILFAKTHIENKQK